MLDPFTSNFETGLVVPMPTLPPADLMRTLSSKFPSLFRLVYNARSPAKLPVPSISFNAPTAAKVHTDPFTTPAKPIFPPKPAVLSSALSTAMMV